jgi:hypothetical protein
MLAESNLGGRLPTIFVDDHLRFLGILGIIRFIDDVPRALHIAKTDCPFDMDGALYSS